MTRFKATLDRTSLMDAVARVLRQADPEEPQEVTRTAFNAARSETPNSQGVPTAAQVCERLERGWADVKEICLGPADRRDHHRSLRGRDPNRRVASRQEVVQALALVAQRRGQDTLSLREYDETVREIEAQGKRAWRHGRPLRLPPAHHVEWAGEWKELLAEAGLKPSSSVQPTLDVVEQIEDFIGAFGASPSHRHLLAWRLAMQEADDSGSPVTWGDHVTDEEYGEPGAMG